MPAPEFGEAAADPQPAQSVEDPSITVQLRERALKYGPATLTNAELLAIAVGGGTAKQNALKIAEAIIGQYGIDKLPGLSIKEWQSIRGVGSAKACQMAAAFELGRRLLAPSVSEEPRISSPAEAYALVRDLKKARKEHLIALYLDAQNRLITRETISVGSLNTTRTHPREVLQPAIVNSALAFILVHNHPSGSLDPSRDDVEFTRTMSRAGELMGINLYDHIIVSRRGFVSLKEKGLL
jgi:DNA repair protein RadC